MAQPSWKPLQLDAGQLAADASLTASVAADHPLSAARLAQESSAAVAVLAGISAAEGDTRKSSVIAAATANVVEQQDGEVDLDPLSAMAMLDPLSAMAAAGAGAGAGGQAGASAPSKTAFSFGAKSRVARDVIRGRSESVAQRDARREEVEQRQFEWDAHKTSILRAHTVAGKIRVTATFLSDVSNQDEQTPVAMDRARARLEALEKTEEDDSVEMSHKEIMSSVEKHRRDLVGAWTRAERVRSLKISIQVAKLLLETSVPQFYPLLFVHVTEILDTFGKLVFKRIFKRAQEAQSKIDPTKRISANFSSADISSDAKETCRNWIYKTACIRELLPRLYVEMALLPCYRFLSDDEFPAIVARLFNCIRGIGDVMVAAYARAYLARCASEVLDMGQTRERVLLGVQDFLYTFKELKQERRMAQLKARGLTPKVYVRLMGDAVLWQIKTVAKDATKEVFTTLLQKYRDNCNDALVLKYMLQCFSAKLYAKHARSMVALINEADETTVLRAECFEAFATALTKHPPPEDQRLPLLNDSWRVVTKVEDPRVYSNCVAAYIGLLIKYYSERELVILLRDCARRMGAAAAAERDAATAADRASGDESKDTDDVGGPDRPKTLPAVAEPGMNKVINLLMSESSQVDFGTIFTSDAFVKILDLFKPEQKAALSKRLLEFFTRTQDPTNDPVVIHMLFDVARTLHDSLDSLSVEDERKQVSNLICRFVDKIDFGRDLEQQLNTLVDCRAVFANLDSVKDRLVLAACQLSMKAFGFMKGRHTPKTAAFVKACFAFCHITIPSIDRLFSRLKLFLLCGQAALLNQCLPQADTFYMAAIQDIEDMGYTLSGEDIKTVLVPYMRDLISAFVVVPGHPDRGPFHLAKALAATMERFDWGDHKACKTEMFIALIGLFAAYGQDVLPYHVAGIESNDKLYAGDPAYSAELEVVVGDTVNAVLGQLTELVADGSAQSKRRQTDLIIQLLQQLLSGFIIDTTNVKLFANLFRLARKNDASHAGLAALLKLVKTRAEEAAQLEDTRGAKPSPWKSMLVLVKVLTGRA